MIDISKGRYWDLPWSLVSSCDRCSPGCTNCWALAMEKRFTPRGFKPRVEGQIVTHPERLSIPLKRRKPTVYSCWNDLFHEAVPVGFQAKVYGQMDFCQRHTFLLLTKRPENMVKFDSKMKGAASNPAWIQPLPNVYHGLTVCNQQEADEKIPVFLQVPGKKFLSIEPALSSVSLWETYLNIKWVEHFDAVIMGAETGPGARPMDLEWARTIRDECEVTGTPFFLKQVDKKHDRLLDGKEHNELPWVTP